MRDDAFLPPQFFVLAFGQFESSVQPTKKFSYAVWRSQDCVEQFVPFMKGRAVGMNVRGHYGLMPRRNRAERPCARRDIFKVPVDRAYFFSPMVT
jgi:hypothetical protein